MSYLHPCLCRKQCVQTFNVFDFLKDIVSKVPDLGGSGATSDDRSVTKRRFVLWLIHLLLGKSFLHTEFCLSYIRKVAGDDGNDSDEELKRSKMVIYQLFLITLNPKFKPVAE